ncbi:MAG: hypothetical protein OEL77_04785 [Nitrosopumilus sp.]|nr:hypothetical protein [Nitrosopumilus sp.]MDH3385312.1 hypothetical protein [Nitrosopumilus sp.]
MRSTIILILIFSVVILKSAFAYHEVREELEISQMTGIFNSQMDWIMFPLVGEEYHLQVVLRDKSQYENANVTVGYGFNLVERIPNKLSSDSKTPFMGFKSTHSTSASRDSKTIQTNQYKFPIIVNFTITFEKPGPHSYSYFDHMIESGGSSSSSGGGLFVVSKYSKAMENDGVCKNPNLIPLAKHDFSTLVCVTSETHHKLITRGWAPLPG